jgi:hypothetical protein
MSSVVLKINADETTVGFDGNKVCLKISAKAYNGLSFNDGKIVATKAADGTGGDPATSNKPGNGIGPVTADADTYLGIVGYNSTVSRHKKYTGTDRFIQENDGPVMTKMDGDHLMAGASIAAYMIGSVGGQ